MTNMCPNENKSVLCCAEKICVQYMKKKHVQYRDKSVLLNKLGQAKEIFHTMQEENAQGQQKK